MGNEFIARHGLIAKSNSSVYGDLNTYGNTLINKSSCPTLTIQDNAALSDTESPRILLHGNGGTHYWIDATGNGLRFSNGTLPGTNSMLLNAAGKLNISGGISVTGVTTGSTIFYDSIGNTVLSGKNTGDQDLRDLSTYSYVNNTFVPKTLTVSAGSAMTGGGALSGNITISHADTSTALSLITTNAAFNVIQNATIALDTYGHVTSTSSSSINLDDHFIKVTGDTMTGDLYVSSATNSTGVTTGAIHTAGGLGVTKNVHIGGVTTHYNDISFTDVGTGFRAIQWISGANDYGRIGCGATASNTGYLEIATADDATEPIYVRQYNGAFATVSRTATLLDGSGNTSFPQAVNGNRFYTGYDANQANTVSCSNWFRSNNATGWLNETYNAGIYSDTNNIVRTYSTNSFRVYNTGTTSIQTDGGIQAAGTIKATGTVTGSNLSGNNTGDQPLGGLATYNYVDSTFLNVNTGGTVNGSLTVNGTISTISSTITGKTAGTTILYNLPTSKGKCAIIDYVIYNTANTALRSGTVTCTFISTAVTYKESATPDLGTSTSAVTFVPIISGANVAFQTIITGSDSWNFKLSIRYLI